MVYDAFPKRGVKLLKVGRRYLNWVQNSVLEGELTPATFAHLKQEVKKIINEEYDSVIFYTWRTARYTKREILGKELAEQDNFI